MPLAVVSGANGFIGRHLCRALAARGWQVVALHRQNAAQTCEAVRSVAVGDLSACPEGDLAFACEGAHAVLHLAGRAHRADGGRSEAELAAYRRDNVTGTVRLYAAAAAAGVERFVHLSSIKVLGDVSARPLAPNDPPAPQCAYARSKLEAERSLLSEDRAGPRLAVVRPPLVYGPGVAGNMAALIRAIDDGWPLPLGRAVGLRSFVAVDNLVDLMLRLADNVPDGRVFHVRDPADLRVCDLAQMIAAGLSRPLRLLPVPRGVVKAAAVVMGRRAMFDRLFEPMQVDDSGTRAALNWFPPVSAEKAIHEMGAWWRTR
jgi:nucleoside-diphosphate-sugar epimerase